MDYKQEYMVPECEVIHGRHASMLTSSGTIVPPPPGNIEGDGEDFNFPIED